MMKPSAADADEEDFVRANVHVNLHCCPVSPGRTPRCLKSKRDRSSEYVSAILGSSGMFRCSVQRSAFTLPLKLQHVSAGQGACITSAPTENISGHYRCWSALPQHFFFACSATRQPVHVAGRAHHSRSVVSTPLPKSTALKTGKNSRLVYDAHTKQIRLRHGQYQRCLPRSTRVRIPAPTAKLFTHSCEVLNHSAARTER